MRRLHANLLLLLTALIWGVTFSVQQMAMDYVGPVLFTGIRFTLGAMMLLPLVVWEIRRLRARDGWTFDRGAVPWMMATGAALFLAALTQQYGINETTVANAGFLTALYVPLTPILAFVVLRQLPHPAIWPAAAACLAGAYLMAEGAMKTINTGDVWVIVGAVFWAIHILLVGAMAMRVRAPLLIAAVQFGVSGALGLIAGGATETVEAARLIDGLGYILFAGFVSVGIGYTLQVVGQRHTPAADASIILSGETVFAALAGMVLVGEMLSLSDVLGGALILAGVISVELLPLTLRNVKARRAARQASD